jgi:hypothetical protein
VLHLKRGCWQGRRNGDWPVELMDTMGHCSREQGMHVEPGCCESLPQGLLSPDTVLRQLLFACSGSGYRIADDRQLLVTLRPEVVPVASREVG